MNKCANCKHYERNLVNTGYGLCTCNYLPVNEEYVCADWISKDSKIMGGNMKYITLSTELAIFYDDKIYNFLLSTGIKYKFFTIQVDDYYFFQIDYFGNMWLCNFFGFKQIINPMIYLENGQYILL